MKPLSRDTKISYQNSRVFELSGNKGSGMFVLVDMDDYDNVIGYKWYLCKGYAVGRVNRKMVKLHRLLMKFPKSLVDHLNGDRLDNRKANLRLATVNQNVHNRSKSPSLKSSIYKGVSFITRNKVWQATINYKSKAYNLGWFLHERHAAMAYDMAAHELFGEYAKANFTL